MKSIFKATMTVLIAGFILSTPVLAADSPLKAAGIGQQKPDMTSVLKDKAASVVEDAKDKVDSAADNLEKKLGVGKEKTEEVKIQEQTETIVTPQGVTKEEVITVKPETPSIPVPGASK